jgi:hypothetical protein
MKTRQPDWTRDKDWNWSFQDARIFPAEDTIKGFILTAAGILIMPFESAEEAMRYHEDNFLINGQAN